MNNIRLYLLFGALGSLIIIPCAALGGFYGALAGLTLAVIAIVYFYMRSDVGIMKKLGARKVTDTSSWTLTLVEEISRKARLGHAPQVYVIPTKAPNACVVGRNANRAQLGLTEGLLETLTKRELEGVVGHELAHIRQCDSKLGGIVSSVVDALMRLTSEGRRLSYTATSRFVGEPERRSGALRSFASLLVTPVAAAFVQLSITRNREFLADRHGATFTNRFQELASALLKIQRSSERMDSDNFPHLAHLFIYSSFRRPFLSALFSSHPPVSERVAQLEKLASTGGGVEGVY